MRNYTLAPKCQGYCLAIILRLVFVLNFEQESLAQTELALGDLRKNLADQQDARTQSEDKYKLALVELEKLKAELERTQADHSAVLTRAEKEEAKLATVQKELSGLKRHISNMTQAIFGKLYLTRQSYPLPWANSLMFNLPVI